MPGCLRLPALVAAPVYGAAMRLRERLYASRWLGSNAVPAPVICVGNLTLGGTGKSPIVDYVTALLRDMGRVPGIVSRGYRRSTPAGQLVIVSDGKHVLSTPDATGDEPYMHAVLLPGTPVAVCANRYEAASALLDKKLCDCIVLDDGFQHLAMRRNADLVLIDSTRRLFDLRQFPSGTLREPLSALRRASAVVHTRTETPNNFAAENRDAVAQICSDTPQFDASFQLGSFSHLGSLSDKGAGAPTGQRVLAFAGIGHPEVFFDALRALGVDVVGRPLPDHVEYTAEQVQALIAPAQRQGCAALVTTMKDAVKLVGLPGTDDVLVAHQTVTLTPRADFECLLRSILNPNEAS